MSKKFKYYAIVGNNGYGLSESWDNIVANADILENEWHKGFQTTEDAYNWILLQAAMRNGLKRAGICSLGELERQRIVIVEDRECSSGNSAMKSCFSGERTRMTQDKEDLMEDMMAEFRNFLKKKSSDKL